MGRRSYLVFDGDEEDTFVIAEIFTPHYEIEPQEPAPEYLWVGEGEWKQVIPREVAILDTGRWSAVEAWDARQDGYATYDSHRPEAAAGTSTPRPFVGLHVVPCSGHKA